MLISLKLLKVEIWKFEHTLIIDFPQSLPSFRIFNTILKIFDFYGFDQVRNHCGGGGSIRCDREGGEEEEEDLGGSPLVAPVCFVFLSEQ